MKILILNFLGRLSQQGGIQTVVRQLLRGVNIDEFDSHVCTIRSHNAEEELPLLGQHKFYSLHLDGPLSVGKKILLMIRLRRLMKALRPDVMHVHSGQAWYAFIAGIGMQISYVLEMHYAPGSNQVSRAIDWIEQKFARLHRVITISHSTEVATRTQSYLSAPPSRLLLIPLAINIDFYNKSINNKNTWRENLSLPDDKSIIFCAARLVNVKNFPLFLETANLILQKNPDTFFCIAGSGPELASLQTLAERLGVKNSIRWLGALHGRELVDAYHATDVFLSTSDYEGFGLTLVEAMAAGKPVVSTAVGGTVDIVIDGETGRLCPAGDAVSLAASVLELLNDPEKAQAWGKAGHERARAHFDLHAFQSGFQAIYKQAAGRSN